MQRSSDSLYPPLLYAKRERLRLIFLIILNRDASYSNSDGRHLFVQDVSLPVCKLLLVVVLHCLFQAQVSESLSSRQALSLLYTPN